MTEENKARTTQSIDLYTGEETPDAEDPGRIIEIVPTDPGNREGENYLLREETAMDSIAADDEADAVTQFSGSYTHDEDVKAQFAKRQMLSAGGRESLEGELETHHASSPRLTGGDLDADWEAADQVGDETVGGMAMTPGQNIVADLGEAVGLTYEEGEPLDSAEKLRQRDRHRWELNPESDS